jgi:hypothetical protein
LSSRYSYSGFRIIVVGACLFCWSARTAQGGSTGLVHSGTDGCFCFHHYVFSPFLCTLSILLGSDRPSIPLFWLFLLYRLVFHDGAKKLRAVFEIPRWDGSGCCWFVSFSSFPRYRKRCNATLIPTDPMTTANVMGPEKKSRSILVHVQRTVTPANRAGRQGSVGVATRSL